MGDLETLIDKAETVFEAEEASEAASRMLEGSFTFDDFLDTLQKVLSMGSLSSILGMVPGMGRQLREAEIDERRIGRIAGMVHSMTPQERAMPHIIDASRRRRIAAGSGCRPSELKELIVQFKQMRSVMQSMGGLDASGALTGRRGRSKRGGRGMRGVRGSLRGGGRGRKPGREGRGRSGRRRRGGRVTPKGTRPAARGQQPPLISEESAYDWPG